MKAAKRYFFREQKNKVKKYRTWGRMLLLLFLIVIGGGMLGYTKSNAAEKIAGHTVFSDKVIESRLAVIRDYYYNKPGQLTVKTISKDYSCSLGSGLTLTYYLHGSDLMFAYGYISNVELRLYFYKNQLVELYVDEPGKSRKSYRQLYRSVQGFPIEHYEEYGLYTDLENISIKFLDQYRYSKNRTSEGGWIIITKMTNSVVCFHKAQYFGPDACVAIMEKKLYTMPLGKNMKIVDDSRRPGEEKRRSKEWFIKELKTWAVGIRCSLQIENGVVEKMYLPYFP